MRCNLIGLLRQAEAIAESAAKRVTHAGMVAYGLSELIDNLIELAGDPEKHWPEFSQVYCLTPDDLAKRAVSPRGQGGE